jgi:PAS domain S-box-containing protein
MDFLTHLFSTGFMPGVDCLRDPALIFLHAGSNGLTAFACFLILITLISLFRQSRDQGFNTFFLLFGFFLLACGATHVLAVVTLWIPVYRLEGLVKAITALASLPAAILLIRVIPQGAALPRDAQMGHEIAQPTLVQEELKTTSTQLESRVFGLTAQLEAVHASLAELTATLDEVQTIIQTLDGTVMLWTTAAELMYGWSRSEALGRKTHELLRSELNQTLSEIQLCLLASGSWNGELKQYRRDGSPIWVNSHWVLHSNPSGEPISVVTVNNDITALKQATAALELSEATNRSLFENASQGIITVNEEGLLVNANLMAHEMFVYYPGELVGSPVDRILPGISLHDQRLCPQEFPSTAPGPDTAAGKSKTALTATRKDNSTFPVEISPCFPVGPPGLYVLFLSDITTRLRIRSERESLVIQLKAALLEKTVLLKEVHHRVKNNLAVIAGLLEMQIEHLEEPRARVSLGESQRRVLSMALIHEYLYGNESFDRVNFGDYVLDLANELVISYGVDPDLIEIAVDADEIELPIHRAMPCGLILNELLTNALKYAFPLHRKGRIEVRFKRLESGVLSLICEDNGVGIPESFDWRNSKSLGMRIIGILSKQISAQLTLKHHNGGTCFELIMPPADVETAAH